MEKKEILRVCRIKKVGIFMSFFFNRFNLKYGQRKNLFFVISSES